MVRRECWVVLYFFFLKFGVFSFGCFCNSEMPPKILKDGTDFLYVCITLLERAMYLTLQYKGLGFDLSDCSRNRSHLGIQQRDQCWS